ncbi:MAG: phosphate acyltransferase PlsX [Deferribacteres bacterium]|nr:phosphate acyltransferase PlsX [candidate division KSB1 bacterium]MCB9500565.1 phosphate acyltransferase PlsX [Deferribacteres bacterium]
MKIALDAMGGDNAPDALVEGGLIASNQCKGEVEVVFVGDLERIEEVIKRNQQLADKARYSIVHASQVVEMDESPAIAIKKKPDASIFVAQKLQKEGKVDAVVSAGSTGAAMASALLTLGRLKGVHRPAIGTFVPHEDDFTFLIDVGANVDSKPRNLVEFAIMGSIFTSKIMGKPRPKVALLSIGEEKKKGNELTLQVHAELSQSKLNFIGNVEGNDILNSEANVIVCDGFVGNILLKFAENLYEVLREQIKRNVRGSKIAMMGAFLMTRVFKIIKKTWDYEEYGGVPLLGINGVVIISHGRSTAKAISNAILEAREMVDKKINEIIQQELENQRGMEIVSENA